MNQDGPSTSKHNQVPEGANNEEYRDTTNVFDVSHESEDSIHTIGNESFDEIGTGGQLLPTGPAGVGLQTKKSARLKRILDKAGKRNKTEILRTPMTEEMNNLAQAMDQLNLTPMAQPPSYIPLSHQAQKLHMVQYQAAKDQATQFTFVKNVATVLATANPDNAALKALEDKLAQQADIMQKQLDFQKQCFDKADKVVSYYKAGLTKPKIEAAPNTYVPTHSRLSPREIISVTGQFNPRDKTSEFTQVWHKLLGYGQANYFTQKEYILAMKYIMLGDAYEMLYQFDQDNKSFDDILDYFGKVYTRKRTLESDRKAVDNFARESNEPLEICMARAVTAIDRLRHLYPEDTWPIQRENLRRVILSQVILPETKRFMDEEEYSVKQSTGMSYNLDTFIEIIAQNERVHNRVPTKPLGTLYQAASGGITQGEACKMKQELQHLRKEVSLHKNHSGCIEGCMGSNPAMPDKRGTDSRRSDRRSSRDSERRSARSSSFDRNRNTQEETETPVPAPRREQPRAPPPPPQGPIRGPPPAPRPEPTPMMVDPPPRSYPTAPDTAYRSQAHNYPPMSRSASRDYYDQYRSPQRQNPDSRSNYPERAENRAQTYDRGYNEARRNDYYNNYGHRSFESRERRPRSESRDREAQRNQTPDRRDDRQRPRSPSPNRSRSYEQERGRSPYRSYSGNGNDQRDYRRESSSRYNNRPRSDSRSGYNGQQRSGSQGRYDSRNSYRGRSGSRSNYFRTDDIRGLTVHLDRRRSN